MIQSTRRHLRLLFISFILFLAQGRTEELFPEYRTVWLSRNVLELGRESIRNAFVDLKNAGFNTIFVNNWYKGSTIYPSQVLTNYGGASQLAEFEGRDPLQVAIEEGHQIGLEIHLWFEYGLWLYMAYDDTTNAGPILSQHPGWLMTKQNGSNYYKDGMYGTVQFWADPANDSAMQFIVELVEEAARNYPELDGIEMDRIRYPSADFSFSDTTRSAYMRETGGSDPLTISTSGAEWVTFVRWRERQTSDVMNKIYRAVKAINPKIVVSAAVAPPYMLSGNEDKMQDWPTWCREGSIDFISPMLYGLQDNFDYWLGRCLSEYSSPIRFVPGFNIDGLTNTQISTIMNATRNRQMPGGAVWYYGYLNETNLSHFGTEIFANPVQTPRNQIVIDDNSTTYVSGSGIASNTGGWNGTYKTGSSGYFKWNIPLYVSGMFSLSVFLPSEWQSAVDWTYQIIVNGDTTIKSPTDDKASGEWASLGYYQLNYDDTVQVIVSSSNPNGFAADAIKLTCILPFEIVEGFPTTPNHVSIQFDRKLDTTSVNISQFAISPSIAIQKVAPDLNDLSVLSFVCDSLTTDIFYRLSAWNLRDSEGNQSDTVTFDFQYRSGFSETIDNSSILFVRQNGIWNSVADSNTIGDSYLKTPCGDGTARVYWRYPAPETGYYQVTAFFPDSAQFADDACYIVKNGSAFDTTRVNLQIHYPNGCPLSVTWAEKGVNIVVKLHNLSNNSSDHWVVADAVKIERTFYSEIEKPAQIIEHFSLLPNYPNPFNGQTTLAFILPKSGNVQIQVFDLTGREVRNLNLKNQAAGRHNLRLDFGDLRSGVYIYRVASNDKQKVGKMALVK
ncbi:MAG: family 10 glycosylhydrolase [Candidatus Marinimicrobia bacterium]|nr:family 10 glycosylhydrolase [Candidatus Neomarinimicrobiota bacterium]